MAKNIVMPNDKVVFKSGYTIEILNVVETVINKHGVRHQLELLSGAPVGIHNTDEIRYLTEDEEFVGHRLNGE